MQLLEDHPWFRIAALSASEKRAGQKYGVSCRWVLDGDMPASVRDMPLQPPSAEALDCRLAFSALPSDVAGPIEEELARAGLAVCSNASSHRMDEDVPLIIPEINPEHVDLIAIQRRRRAWSGLLVTNSNCTSMPVVITLKPLMEAFGVRAAHVVSLQALSGAGYPGLSSLDMVDNILPYVGGEEPKLEAEPLKMLGRLQGERVEPAPITLSAQCNRVAVRDGHVVCLSVSLQRNASPAEVKEALRAYRGPVADLRLPSAPDPLIIVREEDDRPQPRRDRDAGAGMAVVVGRVQRCPLLGIKLVALSHNTIRGAAGGSILNAELLLARGLLGAS